MIRGGSFLLLAAALASIQCSEDTGQRPGAGPSDPGIAGVETGDDGESSGQDRHVVDGHDDDGDGGDTGIKFDLTLPDAAEPLDPNADTPIIPETCAQAQAGRSTVGCAFYAVDLDSHDDLEGEQFAVVISNVQEHQNAKVWIDRKMHGSWEAYGPAVLVKPLSLRKFELPPRSQNGSGIRLGGAYRISSNLPIVAYQFNPIDGASSYSSDASMLYPIPTWDSVNHVVGWKVAVEGLWFRGAYASIVAAKNGTLIEITPTADLVGGPAVPPKRAGETFKLRLDAGDVAEIMTKDFNTGLTGTRIVSDFEHPIAVFSGHECALIPVGVSACDHLEEQMAGVRLWGKRFIASRVPPRTGSDPSLWQIYASEDHTTIRIEADPSLIGVVSKEFELQAGEVVELYVGGTYAKPGDFEVVADKPIAVVNYMTGAANPGAAGVGDPAMVQLSPVEQFLPRYVVLVPSTWENDVAVIARPVHASTSLDGAPIDDALFTPVVDSGYEVARVPVSDGVHTLDGGPSGFSVIIVGYDAFDSYAYLGGSGTGVINPYPND